MQNMKCGEVESVEEWVKFRDTVLGSDLWGYLLAKHIT